MTTAEDKNALTEEPPTLREEDWKVLLNAINYGRCTPFLGAGICHGIVPVAAEFAAKWAKEYHYPLDDPHDLARVAQFVATEYDPMFPKQAIADFIQNLEPPDFRQPNEPHAVLAELPLPIYITTNYDGFMLRALQTRKPNAKLEMCRWNSLLQKDARSYLKAGFQPTKDEPLVYHLHGWCGLPESLVLTEDDYLDFLINVWKDKLIPRRIERSLSGASLLFLGYRLADWDFRVLFRSLVSYLQNSIARNHISVQLVPLGATAQPDQKRKVKQYLDRYFHDMRIRVYWGQCSTFLSELKMRWETFRGGE